VYLPATATSIATLDGHRIDTPLRDNAITTEIGSGKYDFEVVPQQ
jgi:hypothetical protein